MTKTHFFFQVLLLSVNIPPKRSVNYPTEAHGPGDDARQQFEDDTASTPNLLTLLSPASFANFVQQPGTSTGECLLKPLQPPVQLGLDIAADAMTKTHLFIQVLLPSATIAPKLAVDYLTKGRGPGDGAHHLFEDDTASTPYSLTLISPASFTNLVWQPRTSSGECLLKPLQPTGQLGLDIAADAMTKIELANSGAAPLPYHPTEAFSGLPDRSPWFQG